MGVCLHSSQRHLGLEPQEGKTRLDQLWSDLALFFVSAKIQVDSVHDRLCFLNLWFPMTVQAYIESIACHTHDLFEDVHFTPVCICCLCCHVVRMCGKGTYWWDSGKQSHENIKNTDTQQGFSVQFREHKSSIAIDSSGVESSQCKDGRRVILASTLVCCRACLS